MPFKKESLDKLLVLVKKICEEPENDWFKHNLYGNKDSIGIRNEDEKISEIYELCINEILIEQANQFYRDFKYPEIKGILTNDFVRMEKFKRQDNFEDFSLAANQQIECIVNHLCKYDLDFCNYIIMNKNDHAYYFKENSYKLWQLIWSNFKEESEAKKLFEKPLIEWDYVKKIKAVLFYFHFNKNISFYGNFKEILNEINEIYQYRNKNHRGGIQSDYQKEITDKVDENKYRYYFRFMHYLEKFVSKI